MKKRDKNINIKRKMLEKSLGPKGKKELDKAISKIFKEYGETLRLLGKEQWSNPTFFQNLFNRFKEIII